jgi:hypothetical protein
MLVPANSVWNKEELPEQWKESVIVPVCKKGEDTGCTNLRNIIVIFFVFFFTSGYIGTDACSGFKSQPIFPAGVPGFFFR